MTPLTDAGGDWSPTPGITALHILPLVTQQQAERFWGRLEKTTGGCWEFQGSRSAWGYGRFGIGSSATRFRSVQAHRLAWTLTNGEIPGGLFVCHRCDNPPCCNPAHLFVGSNRDNVLDAVSKGRNSPPPNRNADATHCKWGHPFSPENTYVTPIGSRRCRRCHTARQRRYNAEAARAS